jgi:hypothetical protein
MPGQIQGERKGRQAPFAGPGSSGETLYFNKMWNWRYDGLLSDREGRNSKHIYLGESRADGSNTKEERRKMLII